MYNKRALNKDTKASKEPKKLSRKKDIIVDPMGQWNHPGQITRIPSNNITMQGVPYPVLGVDDTGYSQMMYPGQNYTFPGNYVDEYPQMQDGGYIETQLTDEEAQAYRDAGYGIEVITDPLFKKISKEVGSNINPNWENEYFHYSPDRKKVWKTIPDRFKNFQQDIFNKYANEPQFRKVTTVWQEGGSIPKFQTTGEYKTYKQRLADYNKRKNSFVPEYYITDEHANALDSPYGFAMGKYKNFNELTKDLPEKFKKYFEFITPPESKYIYSKFPYEKPTDYYTLKDGLVSYSLYNPDSLLYDLIFIDKEFEKEFSNLPNKLQFASYFGVPVNKTKFEEESPKLISPPVKTQLYRDWEATQPQKLTRQKITKNYRYDPVLKMSVLDERVGGVESTGTDVGGIKVNFQKGGSIPKYQTGDEVYQNLPEEIIYATPESRKKYQDVYAKAQSLLKTFPRAAKLFSENKRYKNKGIEGLSEYVKDVTDYQKNAEDYYRARQSVKSGRLSTDAFNRAYQERGWQQYDNKNVVTSPEDQEKLENIWYGTPDATGRRTWMDDPRNVVDVAKTAAIGSIGAAAAPLLSPTIGAILGNRLVQAGLTTYGAHHAVTKDIPEAYKDFSEGRYWEGLGNTGWAALNLAPIPAFGSNIVKSLPSAKQIRRAANYIPGLESPAFVRAQNIAFERGNKFASDYLFDPKALTKVKKIDAEVSAITKEKLALQQQMRMSENPVEKKELYSQIKKLASKKKALAEGYVNPIRPEVWEKMSALDKQRIASTGTLREAYPGETVLNYKNLLVNPSKPNVNYYGDKISLGNLQGFKDSWLSGSIGLNRAGVGNWAATSRTAPPLSKYKYNPFRYTYRNMSPKEIAETAAHETRHTLQQLKNDWRKSLSSQPKSPLGKEFENALVDKSWYKEVGELDAQTFASKFNVYNKLLKSGVPKEQALNMVTNPSDELWKKILKEPLNQRSVSGHFKPNVSTNQKINLLKYLPATFLTAGSTTIPFLGQESNTNFNTYKQGGKIPKYQTAGEYKTRPEDLINMKNDNAISKQIRQVFTIDQQNKDVLDYYKEYMNSPRYKEMLGDNENIGLQRKYNLGLLWDEAPKLNIRYYQPEDEPNTAGWSTNNTGDITVLPKGYFDKGLLPHEWSHSMDRPAEGSTERAIPQKDIDYINKVTLPDSRILELPMLSEWKNDNLYTLKKSYPEWIQSEIDWKNYVGDPTEVRARLNEIRFQAKKRNIYNPFTQKVTPEIFKILLNRDFETDEEERSDALKQLKDLYTDEQIIYMLNNISQKENSQNKEFDFAQNEEFNFAQKGGIKVNFKKGGLIPKYQTAGQKYNIQKPTFQYYEKPLDVEVMDSQRELNPVIDNIKFIEQAEQTKRRVEAINDLNFWKQQLPEEDYKNIEQAATRGTGKPTWEEEYNRLDELVEDYYQDKEKREKYENRYSHLPEWQQELRKEEDRQKIEADLNNPLLMNSGRAIARPDLIFDLFGAGKVAKGITSGLSSAFTRATGLSGLGEVLSTPAIIGGRALPGVTLGNALDLYAATQIPGLAKDTYTNLSEGNYWDAAATAGEGALYGLGFLNPMWKQGTKSLLDDFANTKIGNKIATGNSPIPYAWKVETPKEFVQLKNRYSLTDDEAEALHEYIRSPYAVKFNEKYKNIINNLAKSNPTIFDDVEKNVITRVIGHSSGAREHPTKYGSVFNYTPGATRSWSLGINPKFANTSRQRLVIPSKYSKDLKQFFAVPYNNPKLRYNMAFHNFKRLKKDFPHLKIETFEDYLKSKHYLESPTMNFQSEKELLGLNPFGWKVIGRANDQGFDNIFIKPLTKANKNMQTIASGSQDIPLFKDYLNQKSGYWNKFKNLIPSSKTFFSLPNNIIGSSSATIPFLGQESNTNSNVYKQGGSINDYKIGDEVDKDTYLRLKKLGYKFE